MLNTPVSELFVRRRVDEALFEELESALLQADCGVPATQALDRCAAQAEGADDGEALKRALKDSLDRAACARWRERSNVSGAKPFVIMIAGVNGSGKTTSIGKLAKWLQSQGKSVLLAAGDTFRAAAREQLVVWGERNDVPVIAQDVRRSRARWCSTRSAPRARAASTSSSPTPPGACRRSCT